MSFGFRISWYRVVSMVGTTISWLSIVTGNGSREISDVHNAHFLVSGFESRISGFEFRVSVSGLREPEVRFRVPGSRFQGFGFRDSGFGFQSSGFGFQVSGFGFRVPSFRFQNLSFIHLWGSRVSGFGLRGQSVPLDDVEGVLVDVALFRKGVGDHVRPAHPLLVVWRRHLLAASG